MIITAIGHLCKDVIHYPNEKETPQEFFGGIMYTLLTLANIMSDRDRIQPVFGVGQADYEQLMERIAQYKNIDPSGIFKIKGPTNQIHLFFNKGANATIECSKHISPPIPFSRIKSYLDGDAVLINMISGSDITLETLDFIRMEIREHGIPVHFDFHSLTLGIDQEFKRFRRPLTDWRRWCFMLNSIQMNEEEALGLSSERYDEQALINQLMTLMVETLIITRGDKGATVITQDIHKKLTRKDIKGTAFGKTADATGCGDMFGAAFLYQYLKCKDRFIAAEYANKIGAVGATIKNPGELDELKNKLEQLDIAIFKPASNGKSNNGS